MKSPFRATNRAVKKESRLAKKVEKAQVKYDKKAAKASKKVDKALTKSDKKIEKARGKVVGAQNKHDVHKDIYSYAFGGGGKLRRTKRRNARANKKSGDSPEPKAAPKLNLKDVKLPDVTPKTDLGRRSKPNIDFDEDQRQHNLMMLRKEINELATQVIRGEWGNGADRKRRLGAMGYYDDVQAEVNRRLKAKNSKKK